jgi:hypothetical protein
MCSVVFGGLDASGAVVVIHRTVRERARTDPDARLVVEFLSRNRRAAETLSDVFERHFGGSGIKRRKRGCLRYSMSFGEVFKEKSG